MQRPQDRERRERRERDQRRRARRRRAAAASAANSSAAATTQRRPPRSRRSRPASRCRAAGRRCRRTRSPRAAPASASADGEPGVEAHAAGAATRPPPRTALTSLRPSGGSVRFHASLPRRGAGGAVAAATASRPRRSPTSAISTISTSGGRSVPKPAASNGAPLSPGRTPVPPIRTASSGPGALAISRCSSGGRRGGRVDAVRDRGRLAPRRACRRPSRAGRARITARQSVYSSRSEGSWSSAPSSSDCEYLPFRTPSSLQSRITLDRAGEGRRGDAAAAQGGQHGDERRGCSRCERHGSWWVATPKPASPRYRNPLDAAKGAGLPHPAAVANLSDAAVTFYRRRHAPYRERYRSTTSSAVSRSMCGPVAQESAQLRDGRARGRSRWPCGASRGGSGVASTTPSRQPRSSASPPQWASRPQPIRSGGNGSSSPATRAVERRHRADLDQARAARHATSARAARPARRHGWCGAAPAGRAGGRTARRTTGSGPGSRAAARRRRRATSTQSASPRRRRRQQRVQVLELAPPGEAVETGVGARARAVGAPSAPSAMLTPVAAAAQLARPSAPSLAAPSGA